MAKIFALVQCVSSQIMPTSSGANVPNHPERSLIERNGTPFTSGIGKIAETAAIWRQRAHQRRQLRNLNDRLLLDIGLDRAGAQREWSKPFWRA